MYAISTNKRKYTTTPIVELILLPNGKTEEKFITCVALPKKEGDKLSLAIVELLNQNLNLVNLITTGSTPVVEESITWQDRVQELIRTGYHVDAMRVYRENTGKTVAECKTYVKDILNANFGKQTKT